MSHVDAFLKGSHTIEHGVGTGLLFRVEWEDREGREPLPDHAGESPVLSRSGGEKGLRGSGAGTLGPWRRYS